VINHSKDVSQDHADVGKPASGCAAVSPPESPAVRVRTALVFGLLWGAWPAAATTLARLDLAEITAHAAAVVRARCLAVRVRGDSNGLWTLTSFERVEMWKGKLPLQFVVRLPGGSAAGRLESIEGTPRFVPGEETVLFLEPLRNGDWTIVGWSQGTFRIRREAQGGAERAVPDSLDARILGPRGAAQNAAPRPALSIERLRATVARIAAGDLP